MKALFRVLRVVMWAVVVAAGVSSCAKDTVVEDPFADWQGVNKALIDSVAAVCANPPEGEVWERYLDYRISAEKNPGDLLEPYNPKIEDYVYVKYSSEKDVYRDFESNPLIMLGDTVMAAFQGFMVDGTRFDGTYFGEFDKEVTDKFEDFAVIDMRSNPNGGLIGGWVNVLLRMKPQTEDKVLVYIPYQMAYGVQGYKNTIPGYSVLKFEMFVEEVIKPKSQN